MQLIIAEKPMLARAIADAIPGRAEQKNGYTVKGGYTIVSAFGHLLTLKEPEDYDEDKYRRWSLENLPIYFDNWGKKPGEGKENRLNLIGELLKSADSVIHAGDPDEEGQYLIDEILDWFGYQGPVYRLATGDTTEAALAASLANLKPNSAFVNQGWSAHARSVADIMVGFNFSRYFTLNNPHVSMLTVGRVQTPTLGLVVNRDLLIENHEKQLYYTLYAELLVEEKQIKARFEPDKNDPNLEDGRITDPNWAQELAAQLQDASFNHVRIERKQFREQPPLPFNLVKLQTYCSNKFGYDPTKTLSITQSLRDNHNAITYNRSDCQYLSEEQYKLSSATVRQVYENLRPDPVGKLLTRFEPDFSLHSKAFDDSNITAHTAIIPQNRRVDLSKLTEEERNVYFAVTKYYLAQFLPAAEKSRTTLEMPFAGGFLRASSEEILSEGYLKLIRPEKKTGEDDANDSQRVLNEIPEGNYCGSCVSAACEEKETKAPPRYTKASLNEDMTRIARYVTDPKAKALLLQKDKDKKGENGSIGTSATRAAIIDALEQRGYIQTKGKQIVSTTLGRELYRILPDQLKKPDMTGLWWAVQESVREGSLPWTALTDSVLEMIRDVLKVSYPKVDAYRVPPEMRRGKLPLGFCPRCGKPVVEGKTAFGCSGYREGCKFTLWKTTANGMLSKTELDAETVHALLASGWEEELSPDESGTSVPTGRKRTKETVVLRKLYSEQKQKTYAGRVFLADEGHASARGTYLQLEDFVHDPPVSFGKCPRCGADVIEGKTGFGCSAFRDGCKFVIWKKAKSGMMSKTRVTGAMVRKLLKSDWIEDVRPSEPGREGAVRRRTEQTVHIKTLYSARTEKSYTGDVFLADDSASPYGASFGLAGITDDGPEFLGKCPRCGCGVLENPKNFYCTGFENGCRFTLWKNSKMKLLANVTFTKTDCKKFLAGKPVRKSKLLDKKGNPFTALLVMEDDPTKPWAPVFRVVEGTVEVKEGDPALIKTETVSLKAEPAERLEQETPAPETPETEGKN